MDKKEAIPRLTKSLNDTRLRDTANEIFGSLSDGLRDRVFSPVPPSGIENDFIEFIGILVEERIDYFGLFRAAWEHAFSVRGNPALYIDIVCKQLIHFYKIGILHGDFIYEIEDDGDDICTDIYYYSEGSDGY